MGKMSRSFFELVPFILCTG